MKKKTAITAVTLLAAGFGIGWTCRPLSFPKEGSSKNSATLVQKSASGREEKFPASSRIQPPSALPEAPGKTVAVKSTDVVRIPLSIIDSAMPVFLSSGDMKNLGVMLMTYNLPSDRYKTLLTGVRDLFAEMQAMEAVHSKLVTAPNGDQYFVVESFAEKGAELRERLQSVIKESFAGIEDDRRWVFQRQLDSSGLFSDFGKSPKEVSIDETTGDDGTPHYSLTIRPSQPGSGAGAQLHSTSSVPLDPIYMRNRYGHLVDKLVQPQSPGG